MSDLIRREDVYDALVEKGQTSKRYKLGETWELNGIEIREALDSVPSAQPEQKVGKWLLYGRGTAKCSQCGMVYIDAYDDDRCFNYCPNCGAKMVVME